MVNPDPTMVPPHELSYQNQLAEVPKIPPVVPRVVLPPEHIVELPVIKVADADK